MSYRDIPPFSPHRLRGLLARRATTRVEGWKPSISLEALYLSESPVAVLQEVEAVRRTAAGLVSLTFSPKTLLSVEYALARLLDLTDEAVREVL